jgi:hypothetical protein
MRGVARDWRPALLLGLAMRVAACERDIVSPGPSVPATASAPDVDDVVAQLEGRHCRYGVDALDACEPRPRRGLLGWIVTRHEDRWTCPTGAARCLAKLGPAARAAVPALLRALDHGPQDVDTGDGVIPVRSSVIEALGRSGDARAVAPVARELTAPAYAFVALEALRELGPIALAQADAVASVLDARLADTDGQARACAQAVTQLELRLATSTVADRLQRAHPAQTRFTIPPADLDAALQAIDRDAEEYRRNREGACRDPVAEAAVRALGAMGSERCVARVVAALDAPLVAGAAARELAHLAPLPPGTEEALQAVLASDRYGLVAKDDARAALWAVQQRAKGPP